MENNHQKLISKLLLLPFLLVVFAFGYYLGINYEKKLIKEDAALDERAGQTADLMLDYGDGQIIAINDIAVGDNETVFTVLKNSSEASGIELKYKDYGGDLGVFIEAIGGRENDFEANVYWQYWVNGRYAKVGPSGQPLAGGDMVEWKFVKGQVGE